MAAHVAFMATRMVQINPQVYSTLQAHISEHVSMKSQGEVGAMIQEDPQMQQMLQQDPEAAEIRVASMIAKRVAEITTQLAQGEAMGQQKDPIVALKERELDLRAMDLQRKAEQDTMGNEIRENEIDEKLDIEKMKLENNEDQAAERIRIAEEKLKIARMRKQK
jgi:hypothetical protein